MTETPIHDDLLREHAEAAVKAAPNDPEGIALVEAIHANKDSRDPRIIKAEQVFRAGLVFAP